jgi:hypothetical protein
MTLEEYIKKLQKLEGAYGNMECIFSGDPDGTHFYWLTDEPQCVEMSSEEIGDGIEERTKQVNAILIN